MPSGLSSGLFSAFIDWMYSTGDISIPGGFHDRCGKINELLDNDVSGVVNTILDYSISSASDTKYRIECKTETLEKLLNMWLEKININVNGIPTGIQELSKEYFKERWSGSSFCMLRFKKWENISFNGVTIKVPTIMWLVNGSSIYVGRDKTQNYVLGSDKYYLDKALKNEISVSEKEGFVIQKPYGRWFDEYSNPYLIRKGVIKNLLGIKVLQEKGDEVISKILPYLFVITKGTEGLYKEDINYDDNDMKKMVQAFTEQLEKYKNERGRTPANGVPFDQKYEHLIPDIRNIMTEELYRQGYRSILSGLGFVDMLEISPSRQESRLNPKAFMAETTDGVIGFKSLLLDVVYKIIEKNKTEHAKLFSDNNKLLIVNTPLKINIDSILDSLRSGYDRGVMSIQSYQEILGLDYDTEKQRRKSELDGGDEDLFYPHLIQNQEATPDREGKILPAKPKNEKNEDTGKKKGSPESKNFKNASKDKNEGMR